jgi:hypothetical protein
MCVQTTKLDVELPNDVDTETAISKLKNKTGHDQILAELIKEGGKPLKKVI